MRRIAIIGVGLIGGSLGLALRKKGWHVTGVGRNRKRLAKAKKLKAVDSFTTDAAEGVKDADIVVICTPVNLIAPFIRKILPFVKKRAVITDAGSAKGRVLREVEKVLKSSEISNLRSVFFVGAHPMAGSERSGVGAAKKDLYRNAGVVITNKTRPGRAGISEVAGMWKKTGAKIVFMDAAKHDRIVASTSHLPHAVAYALSLLASDAVRRDPGARKILAGSFRDMTRIADSDPQDWAKICSYNSKEVGRAIDALIKNLKRIKGSLNRPGELARIFGKGKNARRGLLKK
ncbi:MAG: prephenate dehydrogenase [Endomicrobiales bacterium]|nr:prephenate dehydrogenase [Endomicrobiales bacterium]